MYFADCIQPSAPRRIQLMPASDPDREREYSLFERALRHDPSDYAGSDVDVVNTTESRKPFCRLG